MSKPSISDLKPQQHPSYETNGLSHRESSRSLKAEKVKSTYSMDRLFRSTPRYALPSREGGYERLLALEGQSKTVVSVKFGPRRGLLAEDTLSVDTDLGRLHTSIGAWSKVQDLMEIYKKKKEGKQAGRQGKETALPVNGEHEASDSHTSEEALPAEGKKTKNTWDRRSLPRVGR
jgi:hypothetical protein